MKDDTKWFISPKKENVKQTRYKMKLTMSDPEASGSDFVTNYN